MSKDLKYNPKILKVLVIDDHDPIRKAIKRVLQSMGFADITETFDGSEAINLLKEKRFDMIICDLYMRNVDGFAVLNHVRNRSMGSDLPFIVVTGEASKEDIVKAADVGADDYVLKPFQANDLETKVTDVLTKYYSPSPLVKSLRKAENFFMEGDLLSAHQAFREALDSQPESQRAGLGTALSLHAMGESDDALALLRENSTKNHSYHKNFRALADIHLKLKNIPKAIQCMQRELEINPKQVDRQVQLAKLLLKDSNPNAAIDHFRAALKEQPKLRTALMGIGNAFAETEDLEKSLYYFKRVRRYHPTYSKALDAAIKNCFDAQKSRKAELFLIDEKRGHPDRADTYLALAKFYVHEDRFDEAISNLDDLIRRQNENEQAYRLKGLIYYRYKKFEEASECLIQATKLNPSYDNLIALSDSYAGFEKYGKAVGVLLKALESDHQNHRAYLLLGKAFLSKNEFLKARVMFRIAHAKGAAPDKSLAKAKTCLEFVNQRRKADSSQPKAS